MGIRLRSYAEFAQYTETYSTDRSDFRDWALLEAMVLQQTNAQKAKELFRKIVNYHSQRAHPYGPHNDVYLYEPDLPALKYALKIAKFANLEEELIEDLSTRLSQMEGYEEADLRSNRRNQLRHTDPDGKIIDIEKPFS